MEELADDEERLFARQLTDKINAWLAGPEPTLEVPRVGPAYAKLQEQLLAAGPFQLPPGAEAPGFFVDYTGGAGNGGGGGGGGGGSGEAPAAAAAAAARGMVLVLRRAAPGEVAAAAAASDQALRARVDDAAGFSLLFEAMRDSGKPAVAHNMRYDLAFALQQFVGPLPAGWNEYKALIGGQRQRIAPGWGGAVWVWLSDMSANFGARGATLCRAGGGARVWLGFGWRKTGVRRCRNGGARQRPPCWATPPLPASPWLWAPAPLCSPGQATRSLPNPANPAAKWFPGGLYDTKHLAAQVLGDEGQQLLTDTSLGGLYETLVQQVCVSLFGTPRLHSFGIVHGQSRPDSGGPGCAHVHIHACLHRHAFAHV